MYQLLILEDEKKERDSLTEMISTHFQNEIEVKNADNAAFALELFKQYHFDMVISDINLPGMNGLDFVAYIREHFPHTLIYMLTSYHYFQYGMRAMELKVKDFLLKPIQWESLENCLKEAIRELSEGRKEAHLKKKMEDVKTLFEKDLVYALIEKKEEAYIQHLLDVLMIKPKAAFAVVGKEIEALNKWSHQQSLKLLQARYFDTYVGYIFLEEKVDIMKRSFWSEWLLKHHFQLGNIQCTINDYAFSFEEAIKKTSTKLKYYLEEEQYASKYYEQLLKDIRYSIYKLDETIINKEEKRFLSHIEALDDVLKQKRLYQLQSLLHQNYGVMITSLENEQSLFQPLYQMIETMKDSHQESLYKDATKDEQVAKAIRYISMHYVNNISLNGLAEYMQLTPFYVSRLLKEKTGVTFSEMVTNCRIQHAKKLLLQSDLSMHDIAKQSGFLSTNYFVKVFKRITGELPKEYVSRCKNEDTDR